jgi:modulator of FtsH protease HflK
MNWDWEKLDQQRKRQAGPLPDFDDLGKHFGKLKEFKLPGGKIIAGILVVLWALSGVYIVDPDEAGVVTRFGAFAYQTLPGPHYHIPFPIESAMTPKVTQVRRVEIGYRTVGQAQPQQGQIRIVPEESLMLTGDENIVDVQFIVQYQIKDAVAYLFNIVNPDKAVKDAAEAAMREVIGDSTIDAGLTTGKLQIQNETKDLIQVILDRYKSGIRVAAVQLQNVHPPTEVSDSFKDVASAREDKNRYINEADGYRNDILPKTRGQAAAIVQAAQAYRESVVRHAMGEAGRFLSVVGEYNKAKDVTRTRLYIEAMETLLSNPQMEKILLSDEALKKSVPYLPLSEMKPGVDRPVEKLEKAPDSQPTAQGRAKP